MADVSNRDDVIDSRDVIARIEELQDEREALSEALDEADEAASACEAGAETPELNALTKAQTALDDWNEENADELKALEDLASQAEGYSDDWTYGATLIRDSYFTDYAQELCADIGDIPRDLPGYIVIDWQATADNLKADYTSVEFDGVTYWVR